MKRFVIPPILLVASLFTGAAAEKSRIEIRNQPVDTSEIEFPVSPNILDGQLELCFTMPDRPFSGSKLESVLELRVESDNAVPTEISVVYSVTDYADVYETRRMEVSVGGETVAQFDDRFAGSVNLHGGDNYLLLYFSEGNATLYLGRDRLNYCATISLESPARFVVAGSRGIEMVIGVLETREPLPLSRRVDKDSLFAILTGQDTPPAGLWTYLDRDNDPDFARLGGQYTLAVIPSDGEDSYDIYYVDGAEINNTLWESGMLKGRLTPLPLADRYRLEWWDAEMHKVDDEAYAAMDGGLLSLNFPLLHTVMRFSPAPLPAPSRRLEILFR